MCRLLRVSGCLQQVLLHPDGLLLLIQYPVFDHPDEVLHPCPGLRLQGGIETRDALQLLLFSATKLHKVFL